MAYGCDYGMGQRLVLDYSNHQTRITLASSSAGQQQQATQSLQTASWTAPPEVFQTAGGLVIQLTTAAGVQLIQLQAGQLSQVNAEAIGSALPLALEQIPGAAPMQPMQPMTPMQPMQMGNMSMSLNPMEMRMGDMHLQMSKAASPESKRFCSQCGAGIKPDDRFCASCGSKLEPVS